MPHGLRHLDELAADPDEKPDVDVEIDTHTRVALQVVNRSILPCTGSRRIDNSCRSWRITRASSTSVTSTSASTTIVTSATSDKRYHKYSKEHDIQHAHLNLSRHHSLL